MPYELVELRDGGYRVRNRTTGRIHAEHTSRRKAQAQIRLLNAREHGFRPTGRRSTSTR